MGEYSPEAEHSIFNEAVSNDLHKKSTIKNDDGKTFQEQLKQFDKIIDNAIINNLSKVVLIHGKGQGILRKELHKQLRKNEIVKGFEIDNNNEGQTIVYLK